MTAENILTLIFGSISAIASIFSVIFGIVSLRIKKQNIAIRDDMLIQKTNIDNRIFSVNADTIIGSNVDKSTTINNFHNYCIPNSYKNQEMTELYKKEIKE